MDNRTIAQKLNEYATYLEGEESNLYRVRAYRQAAQTVQGLERSLQETVEQEGRAGLLNLPGIGDSLAYTLECLVRTGEFRTRRPEGGHIDPERLLTSLPGIGPQMAQVLHERLGITSLEGLEKAAHEGRLSEVGIGPKRLRGLIDALAGRLQRSALPEPIRGEPPVDALLALDADYRRQAQAEQGPVAGEDGIVRWVTPRRFNPEQEPWLPVYVADRDGWRYRALYSNTALAHRLGQTHDWVVIYFNDGITSGQRTVVTETRGDLRGLRVVRGRERECRGFYQKDRQTA